MIFETHAHYDDHQYDEDRHELLSGMQQQGVDYVVNVGADLESCATTVELTKQYDYIYGAVGVHPECVGREGALEQALAKLEEYSKLDKIVAIGEIGLDYHYDEFDKNQQMQWFLGQMELAKQLHLPIIVHSRDAANDTVEAMTKANASEIGGVVHCYSYSKELAKTFVKMGFYIGVGGVVTFKNAKKLVETVEYLPLERIVLETDCPYMAPTPYRGSRNSSLYIPAIAEKIAEIKGVTVEQVYETTMKNAKNLYQMGE